MPTVPDALRPRRLAAELVDLVRHAPGTMVWLAILALTAITTSRMSPAHLERMLGHRSTNLANLAHNPLRVLITSLMVFDGGTWFGYAVLFLVFHAPVERRLGTRRWLTIALGAHVLATYVSQGFVAVGIKAGWASPVVARALDYGVSYSLAGVQGVATYLLPHRWRWPYAAVMCAVYLVPFGVEGITFTSIGHLTALAIGFCCVRLTRPRHVTEPPMTGAVA
ncbi:MAG: hypothetical protein L6311_02025 [Cellulomonas sp.]|nr:hypothetical protein [Cellulomonas sp.]